MDSASVWAQSEGVSLDLATGLNINVRSLAESVTEVVPMDTCGCGWMSAAHWQEKKTVFLTFSFCG